MAEEFEGEVIFVGVSNNDTIEDGKNYVSTFDVPYAMAHDPEVWDLYDVPYQPVTIVISGEGGMANRVEGPITYSGLRQIIEQEL